MLPIRTLLPIRTIKIPMKNINLQKIPLSLVAGLLLLAGRHAYSADPVPVVQVATQPEFPVILRQPEDQMVYFSSNATFKVVAQNADGYQWLRNGVPLPDQTNSSLTIKDAQISDVGYYLCNVFKDIEVVPTRAASLMVYTNTVDPQTGIDPITVFGLPLLGGGGSGSCPGPYVGYVNYTKTIANGWGWKPDTNTTTVFYAMDANRTNTKIEYVGKFGDNSCAKTKVTVPNPPGSPSYRFTIYFTNNVPTNAYAITLDGFLP